MDVVKLDHIMLDRADEIVVKHWNGAPNIFKK
jgi:hypothetical protein